jgi:hypothetical protein
MWWRRTNRGLNATAGVSLFGLCEAVSSVATQRKCLRQLARAPNRHRV